MKRSNTWIAVDILLSGAVALSLKSAGAAPFQIMLVPVTPTASPINFLRR